MNISTQASCDLTQIGHYEILACIGRGGMGLVYRARDTRLDRQVAIKCLRAELFEKHYRERFRREALLLAKLNHTHIVHIYDYLETEDQLALVMEYVDGQNLQVQLREHIIPFKQRMQWLVQIAQGLAVAHDAGIIHRDLKAENILINKRNIAKISDLGIAKSQDFNATLTDHVTGSYGSMSPEQAMGEELDFKSDLFSFGILAYQLLCGAHPFGETDNKLQLMQRIISHPPIPPTRRNPDLPVEICTLLGQLLSKNIDNRPDNTHWVAAQLEKLSQQIIETAANNDTQMLTGNHSHNGKASNSGIRTTKMQYTEHPTFTNYSGDSKNPLLAGFRSKGYKSVFAALSLILLLATGFGIWQLQPKQPKYIAVIPPKLTANGMQESQQELVKGAVYDAIQQSVIQLDGYYLIPRAEIEDVHGDSEAVRRATAADELIVTEIQCKVETCTIILSRLTPEGENAEARLRVRDTRTVDILTDNYLSVAELIQSNIGFYYSENVDNTFEQISAQNYTLLLKANQEYRSQGANKELLIALEKLPESAKGLATAQTLYTEAVLDLHHETKDIQLIEKLAKYLKPDSDHKSNISHLYNLFYLKIAKENFGEAEEIIEKIRKINPGNSAVNEMKGYAMMAKKDYQSAINFYKKSLAHKKTANSLYLTAKSYWYAGENTRALELLTQSLSLSPNYYKSHRLLGLIYLINGNISKATTAFEISLSQKPNDTFNLNNLGLCYLLTGDYVRAKLLFGQASAIAPSYSTLRSNIADAENLMGNIEASHTTYNEIIKSMRDKTLSIDDLRSRSQAYAHLGQYSHALTDLQNLEIKDSQNIETTFTAALVHTLSGNKASALLNTEKALKNGMHRVWFNFSWFDSLCKEEKFKLIMKDFGGPNRCALR